MAYHQGSPQQQNGQQQNGQQQQQQNNQQQQQQNNQPPAENPIVQVNLIALPGEWEFQITGEEYSGKYHLHQDGTAMIGVGTLGVDHDIIPEEVIISSLEHVIFNDYYYGLGYELDVPALTNAPSNFFTEYIVEKPYSWLVERVPNITNFLTIFSNLINNYNGYVAGGYLRRVVQSGDAFQFQNADIDFWFDDEQNLFNAVNFINQGNIVEFHQPELQEIRPDKFLYSWDLISNATNVPNVKLQIISRLIGNIENILSYFDFTNAKISTNSNKVVIDGRWENFESGKFVNIDTFNPPVLQRLLKYLYSEGEPFRLNPLSALEFLTWVAPRASSSSHMQELYDVLLNASEVTYDTISFIEPYLSELNLPSGRLSPVNLPLIMGQPTGIVG